VGRVRRIEIPGWSLGDCRSRDSENCRRSGPEQTPGRSDSSKRHFRASRQHDSVALMAARGRCRYSDFQR
jgi:hypothetical protein